MIINKKAAKRFNDMFMKEIYRSIIITKQHKLFTEVENGVIIIYSCGTKRFISNSWYDDIDTDNL